MPKQQNPDGSWSEAVPLGWQGGHDWEVYADEKPKRANLYDEDMLCAVVTAQTRRGLARKMRRAQKRLGVTHATTFCTSPVDPPLNIGDTCCGQCPGGACYVDGVTGA